VTGATSASAAACSSLSKRSRSALLSQDLGCADAPCAGEAQQDAAVVDGTDVVLDAAGHQPDLIDQAIGGGGEPD
jgi:hypothetical protein